MEAKALEGAAKKETSEKKGKTLKDGYNRVMLYIEPEIQLKLEAYGGMTGRPLWSVTEEAFLHYLQSLTPADKELVAANVTRRKKEKELEKKEDRGSTA